MTLIILGIWLAHLYGTMLAFVCRKLVGVFGKRVGRQFLRIRIFISFKTMALRYRRINIQSPFGTSFQ